MSWPIYPGLLISNDTLLSSPTSSNTPLLAFASQPYHIGLTELRSSDCCSPFVHLVVIRLMRVVAFRGAQSLVPLFHLTGAMGNGSRPEHRPIARRCGGQFAVSGCPRIVWRLGGVPGGSRLIQRCSQVSFCQHTKTNKIFLGLDLRFCRKKARQQWDQNRNFFSASRSYLAEVSYPRGSKRGIGIFQIF